MSWRMKTTSSELLANITCSINMILPEIVPGAASWNGEAWYLKSFNMQWAAPVHCMASRNGTWQ